jgi:hypothetical protein
MAGDEAISAIPDLLNFDPVPRRARADGWTAEHQRAFIAALAVTGSARQAARAIGKHAEQSRLAEVRNGLDHYRDEDQFPSQDVLLACEARLLSALESADLRSFLPKTLWLLEKREDQYDSREYTLVDYKERKYRIVRPSVFIGLPTPDYNRPVVMSPVNLLGVSTAEMVFVVERKSDFTTLWEGYPRRPLPAAIPPIAGEVGSEME